MICLLFVASTLSTALAQPRTATVQLDSVWGCPGQEIEVPLRVSGISELGVDNFHFTIRLPDGLEPVLLSHDPETNRGFPSITFFNEELQQRGSFVANFMDSEIMISWIDRTAGRPSPKLEDGSVLLHLNLRIRGSLATPEAIQIRIATMNHLIWPHSFPYQVNSPNGYVLAKSAPNVRIDRTFMDNPRYSQQGWPAGSSSRFSDVTLCVDEPFQLKATGAERFEWRSLPVPWAFFIPEGREYLVLDRSDVHNPVFTGRSAEWFSEIRPWIWQPTWPLPRVLQYNFVVRGYNSDGCFGTDTVRIWMDEEIRHPLVDQPTHMIIERGESIDLALELKPMPRSDLPDWENHWAPQVIRWFPHDLIRDPKEVIQWTQEPIGTVPRVVKTQTAPIYESTWIWAEVRQLPLHIADTSLARAANTRQGCVQFLNIRVDIKGEMFNARISAMNPENLQEYDYFCGTPGLTEQRTMLAALVEGGSGRRSYEWEFRRLYDGLEPILVDAFANPTEIIFFGSTEVFVTIFDSVSEQRITLSHTITVETPRTLSVNIAMDDASQRFFEMGFCEVPHMPLTLLANVDNQGALYQIFWEETRPVHTAEGVVHRTYRVQGMEGAVARFPQARAGAVYRAVVQSSDRCVTQSTVRSNEIDPQSQWFESSSVFLVNVSSPTGCNTAPSEIRFRAFNTGTDPLFHIYRNGEMVEEYTRHIPNPTALGVDFIRPVQSLNYWDRFSVRFTNQSARCLRFPSVMSEEVTPNIQTTNQLSLGHIVSIFGSANEICDTPDGVFTFHLEDMEQFGRGTTVIWKVNDTEWGRYEFDPSIATAVARERQDGAVLLNELLNTSDSMAFASRYAFHLNAEGFPQVGTDFRAGDRLSVTVISRVMCGASTGNFQIEETSLTPKFIDIRDATLTLTQDNPDVCKGDRIEFTASVQNMNMDVGVMSWFFNGRRVGEGTTFTLNHALNEDVVEVVFESNFACAPNLPLRERRVIDVQDLPTLAILADTLICAGDALQLYAETNAAEFLWTGNNFLGDIDIQNPVAEPAGVNTTHDFTVTVTDERGCQSTASITVRTAPNVEIAANIWLQNLADTIVCRDHLVMVNSEFFPLAGANVERTWLRNGIRTQHTGQELGASAIRDGDVWQLQVAMPTLNTCRPRTVLSNPIVLRTGGVTLELAPRHPNNCANPEGQYLFVAVPVCANDWPGFDWYINNVWDRFTAGNPLFGAFLNPGDEVRVRLTNCRGNVSMSEPIRIIESPQMPIVEGARVICFEDATTTLTVEQPQNNVTFRWYSAADNFAQPIYSGPTLSGVSAGVYRVVATSEESNCENLAYVEITEGTQPYSRITLLTPRSEVRTREPIRFRNDATGWATAYWQFGNGNGEIEHHGNIVEHEFVSIQNYEIVLRVVSMDGCEATYSISLDVQPGMVGVFVPTAFMPNSSDERNRYLRVFAAEQNPITSLRLSVFAMDGRELFTTNDPNRGWDGRYNGRDMPTGNYSWMVSARLASGEEIVRSGVATLVR